ncbi:DoxX family membrane protein [Streptomyces diacarni]|uniref:DoxX family membrane protein n=1 Tax=Streptomyces diacarni TaxID=2800381 RepID=A0A367EYD5_9ACTN|nr:DoxX family membrane protein [Streptomyces diacarni]RCG23144.1 DoxX family membrane protein [Streptomyces diacarni]
MTPLQLVARPLLGTFFVSSGVESLSEPEPRAEMAGPFLAKLREKAPGLPDDDVLLVRVNAAVQVAAGALLTVGRLPRLASLALAASLVPTTLAGHPFWEHEDAGQRAAQRTQLAKNGAVLGGLAAVISDAGHQARIHALRARARHRRPCPVGSRKSSLPTKNSLPTKKALKNARQSLGQKGASLSAK